MSPNVSMWPSGPLSLTVYIQYGIGVNTRARSISQPRTSRPDLASCALLSAFLCPILHSGVALGPGPCPGARTPPVSPGPSPGLSHRRSAVPTPHTPLPPHISHVTSQSMVLSLCSLACRHCPAAAAPPSDAAAPRRYSCHAVQPRARPGRPHRSAPDGTRGA